MATLRPGRDGSHHVAHVGSFPIHCHTPTRQMEHCSSKLHDPKMSNSTGCVARQSLFLPNLPQIRKSNGHAQAWKGWIPPCSSCRKLSNPLPYTHKANGTLQQQAP